VSWSIHIPHRSPEDPLVDVAEAAHVLPTDEARVVRQLVLGELVDGSAKSAGELLDKLEAASPEERRKMLDAAREAAGLERTEDIDFREQHAVVQRNACARAFGGPPPRLGTAGPAGSSTWPSRSRSASAPRRREESLRRQRVEREAEQAVEAEEFRRAERARAEAERRELPPGFAA
jgi:hypothetical protein